MRTHRAFGIEQEHFVFHDDGSPPFGFEIDEIWERLADDGFYPKARDVNGNIVSLAKDTPWGPAVLSNDCCTHIIEVAFPKLNDLSHFKSLYLDIWGILAARLWEFGLRVHQGGAIPAIPDKIRWRAKESDLNGTRLAAFIHRPAIDHPLYVAAFPACFTSTHVSLDIPQAEAVAKLRRLYAYEFLVPLYFSNSFEFQGVKGHCVRVPAWTANFNRPYLLVGVPDSIPETLEEYQALLRNTPGRDFSFISIRSERRLEFRTACSQNTVDEIIRLVKLRMAIDRATDIEHETWDPQLAMDLACGQNPFPHPYARQALDRLVNASKNKCEAVEKLMSVGY